MLEKTLNRIMLGAKTPEGKVIAILLTVSLALMTWNATSISVAFADDQEDALVANDTPAEVVDDAAGGGQASADAQEPAPAPEASEAAGDEAATAEVFQSAPEPSGEAASSEAVVADDEQAASAESAASEESAAKDADEAGEKSDAEVEVAYPAVTFEAQYVNGAAITASADKGAFPEGAYVELGYADYDSVYAAVNATTSHEIVSVHPVKLVFRDADGNEITPKGKVTVKVDWSTPLEGNAHVFTIADSGTAEAVSGSNLVSETSTKQEFKLSAEQAVRAFAVAATTEATTNDADADATEEEASENERTESAETGYPEQTISGRTGWTVVKIEAPEGSLPEGAKVNVAKVDTASVADAVEAAAEAQGKTVGDMVALDVTITDKDGKEIQPLKPVSVQFVNVGISGDDISVYHVADNKASASEVTTDIAAGAVQSFEADGFSIYAVVSAGEDARVLVKFVSGTKSDGEGQTVDNVIASMYVKEGDNMEQVLYDPGVGDLDEKVYFRGWTTDKNYTTNTQALSIAEVRTAVSGMLPPATDETEVT